MSQFIPVELHHASRLLNHGPTVMITSFDEQSQRRNIMAAAWSMPVEFEPPRVAIVVDKSTWTRELIERNGKVGPPGTFFYHGGFGYNGAFRTYDWYRGKLSVKAGIKFLLRHACGQRPRKTSSPKAHEHTTNC